MPRYFTELVRAGWKKEFYSCVGLDSQFKRIPDCVKDRSRNDDDVMFEFNRCIINSTCDAVAAFKINAGFYLARGWEGVRALELTFAYLREHAPKIPTILDAKSGDIGASNEAYAEFAFEVCQADAVTLHNYLGLESLKPFEQYEGKGLIVLARTSNPGGGEFQDLDLDTSPVRPLYQHVARRIANTWSKTGNYWLVAGATYKDEVAAIRHLAPAAGLLLPGFGKQGASIEDVIPVAKCSDGHGFLANSSSGIIFASKGEDFAAAARKELENFNREIAEAKALDTLTFPED